MKISIKSLQGKITEIMVEETETLADLKKKIFTQMNVEQSCQKLIHYGRIMTEEGKKLSEYNVKENDFIVLMVNKVFSSFSSVLESGSSRGCTKA